MTKTQLFISVILIIVTAYFFLGETGNIYYTQKIDKLVADGPQKSDTVKVTDAESGIPFSSNWALSKHLLSVEQNSFLKYFPLVKKFPDIFSLILGCCSIACFGYILRLLLATTRPKANSSFYKGILTAFLTGLVVFILLKAVPELFIKGDINSYFPLGISLLSGLFMFRFYILLAKKFPNVFAK
jgi:hypothetical protein